MVSFCDQLEELVLAGGIPPAVWDEFIQALRESGDLIACWIGQTTQGEMILNAWHNEFRVDAQSIRDLAQPLIQMLRAEGPRGITKGLSRLQCCRGFESAWRAPVARDVSGAPMATATTVTTMCRHYFDLDPGGGLISGRDYDNIVLLLQKTNPDDHRKLMGSFLQPLGKRKGVPAPCQSSRLPYPDRFDIVRALREDDVPAHATPDEIRDILGLVHFRAAQDVTFFIYRLEDNLTLHVPTVIEALGGWAFWPAAKPEKQKTRNYRDGRVGPREFVHSAEIPPPSMRPRWVGTLTRNWDDAP